MSSEVGLSLGEIIKADIKKKKLNGAAIAREMKVSRQVINQIDLRKSFDLEFLQKLKNATGLDYTNYVFDPKAKAYVDLDQVYALKEPSGEYDLTSNSIELSLTLKISAQQSDFLRLSQLISSFKDEAVKYGFKLV